MANLSISGGGSPCSSGVSRPAIAAVVEPRVQLVTVDAADDPQLDLEPFGIRVQPRDPDRDFVGAGQHQLERKHSREYALRCSQPRREVVAYRPWLGRLAECIVLEAYARCAL